MNPSELKKLFEKRKIQPQKGLGQNFLVHEGLLDTIAKAADLKRGDVVLEIGPGLGILTQALAETAKRVVAVEKDPTMVDILLKTLGKDYPNVEIIEKDILKAHLKLPKTYKIVANLPYYIAAPVIRKFLEAKVQPKVMVLMVQKEVARRICAKPPEMSLLALSVQFYAKPEIVSTVSKNAFWPQPKVDSAILRITPLTKVPVDVDAFFRVMKAGFKQPRKQLAGNLSKGLDIPREEVEKILSQHSLNPAARAETLLLEDWHSLAKSFSKK